MTYNDETASGGSFYRTISDNLSAYDDICDICIPGIMDAATLASAGAFVDLSSGDVPHLDLEKPWWNKTLNDSMRILNRQYFAISDALLNDKLDINDVTQVIHDDASPLFDEDVRDIRRMLKDRPEMKMLFSITKNASREDIERAVAIIEAIKTSK